MTRLTFHGAAGCVTGSKTLLDAEGGGRLLVDCGLFQGLKSLRELNWEAPPFDARGLEWLVLTHAHIDHIGWLPRLYTAGFRGSIFGTPATAELAVLLLLDSARLQEEDARFLNEKGATRHAPALPLYTERDARNVLTLLKTVPYGVAKTLAPGLSFRFLSAGHLLGSAMVEVHAGGRTILFSGDVGRYGVPLAPDPLPPVPCDTLVLESTYGDRIHPEESLHERLASIAERTFGRSGVLLVPAFAVGRAQQVIFILRELYESGRLPRMPIHLDSPMAVDATRIYARHREELDALRSPRPDRTFLSAPEVTFHRSGEESKALNAFQGPGVIISSSGMLTGGRILHHLARRLPDPKNTVLIVGYQAEGTRGRSLIEGARTLRFHGEEVEVRAEIAQMHGMSGHADAVELMRWTESLPAPGKVFLNHGEPSAARALAERLRAGRSWNAIVPELHQTFDV